MEQKLSHFQTDTIYTYGMITQCTVHFYGVCLVYIPVLELMDHILLFPVEQV